ncbi:energy transducer TonB [Epilithonimonas sp. UC225_85]|uniref:energy transducer TonB n=1 Tax=Epilithonimonas sp. UC225_85 TaxID=3350167 RepID=UPI0036D314AC
MRILLLIITLLISPAAFSQSESTKAAITADSKAEFPGGQTAFRNEFMKMVRAYVDITAYAVNGKFSFVLTIDEKGKMSELKIYPKVKYDEEFRQDMEFAMKRIKKKWKPAMKNGVPVSSNIIFEINFSSEHSDEEY